MAKLKIKKIEIVGNLAHSEKIVKYIQRRGVVELTETRDADKFSLQSVDVTEQLSQLEQTKTQCENALEILKPYSKKKGGLLSGLSGRPEIDEDEFEKRRLDNGDTYQTVNSVIETSKTLSDINVQILRLQTRQDALTPWLVYDLPLSFTGTDRFSVLLGSFPHKLSREDILSFSAEKLPEIESVDCEIIYGSADMTSVCVYCLTKDKPDVERALRELGFSSFSEKSDKTPKQLSDELQTQIDKLNETAKQKKFYLEEISEYIDKINFLLDCISIETDRLTAVREEKRSERIFVLTGYVPETKAEKIKQDIESKYDAAAEIIEPDDDEDVPVQLKNNGFCKPLEWITEMYSLPGKLDPDPTPIMAFFYYFFFGMMLSDAGYGVLIVIACAIALWKGKFEDAFRDKIKMFLFCGLSTVFWGAMYGSWFGDLPVVVGQTFMGKEKFSLALWKDPLNELLEVLVWCFIFGVVHLFTGVMVKAVTLWRHGKKFDALCESIPTYVCILGLAPIFFGLFTEVPAILKTIGTPVLIVGVVLVVATAGRESKSVGGKIGKGFYGLYNLISGYLGDVLSYARLLALGLSTGVIAQVVNMLCTLPSSKALQAIMLVVVGLFGHVLNLLINIIGAYVHTNRLQYVEFFGKFYEGGGRALTPLKMNTKSYKIKEEI